MTRRCLFLLFTLVLTYPLFAEETAVQPALNFHRWGSVTVFNGLPSDSVRAIAQTPDGILWFGTDNGLARFDGRRIQTFTFQDADANRILSLKTSQDGRLWVGTQNGAYVYFDGGFQPIGGTAGFGITALLAGTEIYMATDRGFVLHLPLDGERVASKLMPEALNGPDGQGLRITSLAERNGQLLLGTYGRGTFTLKDGHATEIVFTGRPMFVNALSARGAQLSIGADAKKDSSGIFRLSADSHGENIKAPTAKVLVIEYDDHGLWAGTDRYGLFHIDNSVQNLTFENTSGGLRSNTVNAIFTDREGIVWVGTNRGVSRFDPAGAFQQTVSDIPNSNFIRTLFRANDGTIYAGSNRGLFMAKGGTWNEVQGLKNRVVYAISQNSPSSTIVGTASGSFDISGKSQADGDTRAFTNYKGATYAAVFGTGVLDLSAPDQTIVFPNQLVTSVFADDNKLWIGTSGNGLFSYDGNSVRAEVAPEVLRSGTIWKMVEKDDRLWVAGEHGVFTFKDGQVESIVAAEDVRDLYFNGADLWAATTTRGLIHARKDERLGWIFSAIGFEQGLPSEKAFSILPSEDELLIATNRGVVTYAPGKTAPKVVAIRVLSQRLHDLSEINTTIALDYPQNSLLVEVAGLSSRTFPEEFQYSFVLKNAKGESVDQKFSNDPQYNPSGLKPGEYSIESIAFDRDLNQSEPLVIKFSIARAPFPWTAAGLAFLLALALVGLAWAFFEHRRMRQRNKELAAAKFDLANEAERERSRIARDLHDQTLADLRNLMIRSDKGAIDNREFREEIESVSTEIRRICEDLSPSVLENVGLMAALEFLLSQTIETYEFSAEEGVEERTSFPLNVQLQIYRIAQEVLTNIKRHSDADLVEMKIEVPEDAAFLMTIRDNGSAFQPAAAGKGRGISNIRSRANLINGRAAWKERRRGGNVFSLRIGDG
jgi:signal transduction histidine kinase/ligand-binding sensor domain-containing protein